MKIYIAGPYSKGDKLTNTKIAMTQAELVLQKGHIPHIPHLTHFWDEFYPHPYEFWLEYDKVWLRDCDAVLRIDGESRGADTEVTLAKELGMPVYYSIEQVPVNE